MDKHVFTQTVVRTWRNNRRGMGGHICGTVEQHDERYLLVFRNNKEKCYYQLLIMVTQTWLGLWKS